ncbi:MAG: hypothetical protein RSD35_02930 [Oscillospiraceae bacterium]
MGFKMEAIILVAIAVAAALIAITIFNSIANTNKKKKLLSMFGSVPDARYKDEDIPKYWEELQSKRPDKRYIDGITWNDLDMDDVFDRINCCQSSVGQERLYAQLHMPTDADTLLGREKLYDSLKNEELRVKTQLLLKNLGKKRGNGLWLLMFYPEAYSLEHSWRFKIQAVLPILGIICMFFNTQVGLLLTAAFLLANVATYFIVKKRTDNYIETISYFLKTLSCAAKLKKLLAKDCPELSLNLGKSIDDFKKLNFDSFILMSSPSSDADMFVSAIGMITLVPIIQYCAAVKYLKGSGDKAERLFSLVGEIDSAVSVLSFRKSLPAYCRPEFTDTLKISAVDIFHPLIAMPIKNNAEIGANILLTGSNASGKSTYIKAIAINAILAQTINTCCADKFALKSATVISSMAVADSIVGGESYFVAEIKSMRRIISAADSGVQCYCFIDEILKGTNTIERISASASVLKHLSEKDVRCIAATHDIELTQLLEKEYLNMHFSEQVTDSGVSFDYKLKQGPATTRNAIRLLSFYDYPKDVTELAQHYVNTLEERQ